MVDRELKDLEKTLQNIESARPFEDLTVVSIFSFASETTWSLWNGGMLTWGLLRQDEIAAAQPDIDKHTAGLVSKGRWQVPGYKVHYELLLLL